jgi:hypothetical protein
MCESYHMRCECGQKSAEIFFGKMLLDNQALNHLYCPDCSETEMNINDDRIIDNGWVLVLNMDHIRQYSSTFGMTPGDLSANWVFDHGYVTWVGITPNDSETRNLERAQILELAKIDMIAYLRAMKNWGRGREERFSQQGWRKMQC